MNQWGYAFCFYKRCAYFHTFFVAQTSWGCLWVDDETPWSVFFHLAVVIQLFLVLASSGLSSLFLAYGTLSLLKHNRDGENGWNVVLGSFCLSLAGTCPFLFLFWWIDSIFWLNACFWFLLNGYERTSNHFLFFLWSVNIFWLNACFGFKPNGFKQTSNHFSESNVII